MKFGMEIYHKHTYIFSVNIAYKSIITIMVTVQKFEGMSHKFNRDRICT